MDDRQRLELCELALDVAVDAAALVGDAFGARKHPQYKDGFADLVTEYDQRAEALIRRRLEPAGLPLVGEEQGGHAEGPSFHIDPIDGTTNFVHGHPFFCVSIGVLDGARPLLGAIVAPALGHRWVGGPGLPTTRDGLPCRVSDARTLDQALLATGFAPGARRAEGRRNIENFRVLLPSVRGVRRCGSAALDLAMTADGTYDAYWELGLNSWDAAAGAALVLGAGGRLTDLTGGAVDFRQGHLCASNGHLHDALLQAFVDVGGPPPR